MGDNGFTKSIVSNGITTIDNFKQIQNKKVICQRIEIWDKNKNGIPEKFNTTVFDDNGQKTWSIFEKDSNENGINETVTFSYYENNRLVKTDVQIDSNENGIAEERKITTIDKNDQLKEEVLVSPEENGIFIPKTK